jgi:epoxide hydrolase-like predicted phosphatase
MVPSGAMPRPFDAILFDFGGVFTPSPFGAVRAFASELGADPERVLGLVFGPYDEDTDHPWHRLERGEIPLVEAREGIRALAREHALELDLFHVLRALAESGRPGVREVVVERTRALRAEGYRTALVTNNAAEFAASWRPLLPLAELFDAVVDSSEVGLRKPDPRIYHHALERLGGVVPARAIFLDDWAGNVEAARRLGLHGVVVGEDPGPALDELARLLAARGREPLWR